ncbi:Holliday junction resolvase RuvX [bacterium]|nr:Holliday junction resolvase RuvX [bacterium]
MDRILALDYGDKRIGVAVSDPLGIIAQALETITVSNKRKSFERIQEIIREKNAVKIIVGMPFNMNGTKGERAEVTERFISELQRVVSIEIIPWDERLTSVQAKRIMVFRGQKTGTNKAKVDKLAAALLLENYLESRAQK